MKGENWSLGCMSELGELVDIIREARQEIFRKFLVNWQCAETIDMLGIQLYVEI